MLVFDYPDIVAEWLHTGRPLVQLTDVADRELPAVGLTTDRLRIETVERLYAEGYPDPVAERRERVLDRSGFRWTAALASAPYEAPGTDGRRGGSLRLG